MKLWPHQATARAGIISAWREGARRVLVVCPTGGGKTRLASSIVADYLRAHAAKGGRVVWLAHRAELVDQAARTLLSYGLDVGHAGLLPSAPVQVATVQTLIAQGEVPTGTLVVADEAHHYVEGNDWARVLAAYVAAGARILGLTATPSRADGRGLGEGETGYERLVVAAQVGELQRAALLVPCHVTRPVGGKLQPDQLAREPVEAYLERTPNGRAVVFAAHEKAAHDYAKGFMRAAIRTAVVLGRTKWEEREASLRAFADGSIRVIVNVMVLTEGWDCPPADVVIIARGCSSAGMYLQVTGRGLRASPGKGHCDLLDLRGVSWDHGRPDEDRVFSLDGRAIIRKALVGAPVCKVCKEPLPETGGCPNCGRERDELVVARGIGARLDRYEACKALPRTEQAKILAGILRKGRSTKAAGVIFAKMCGRWPSASEIAEARRMG